MENTDQMQQVEYQIKLHVETIKHELKLKDKQFEKVDKRFEELYKYIDRRIETESAQLKDNMNFNRNFTIMNIVFVAAIVIMILLNFLP
ncbi:hypothetical protein H8E88_10820 [candidate division KSB1 bacterium]|nr:hypothetical protein [candidate division KSB1 bacterium]